MKTYNIYKDEVINMSEMVEKARKYELEEVSC